MNRSCKIIGVPRISAEETDTIWLIHYISCRLVRLHGMDTLYKGEDNDQLSSSMWRPRLQL